VKPLLVLLFFGFLILIFVGGALGETDLTPDTPPAAAGSGSSNTLLSTGLSIGSSPCASPYTVVAGDTLSEIAKRCSLTLADMLSANPAISSADLIYIDQVLVIPRSAVPAAASAPTATAAQAVMAAPPPTATSTAVVVEAAQPAAPTEDAILSAFETGRAPQKEKQSPTRAATPRPTASTTAIKPGSHVEVVVEGFPANALVVFGIGQVGKDPFMIDEMITDDQGVARVTVTIPENALAGQQWTVTISTAGVTPEISATAVPFTIGQ
jgi:LysM repeat protein